VPDEKTPPNGQVAAPSANGTGDGQIADGG
jgi:hypothetical protein